jgi:hypothetical protein
LHSRNSPNSIRCFQFAPPRPRIRCRPAGSSVVDEITFRCGGGRSAEFDRIRSVMSR